jgi:hypothetical protein
VSRCVVIYPAGGAEVVPANPANHRRLRALGFSRFIVKLEREQGVPQDSAPIYARSQPSKHELADAAAQLWGIDSGFLSVFDENGELLASE